YILSHFLSSHDVPGALFQLQGDKNLFRLAAVLQFTSPGLPMIYYGEEVGRLGGDWPDNRSDMPWGDRDIKPGAGLTRDEELRSFYRKLIAIRRQHPALSRGIHTNLALEGDLLVFQEKDMQSGDTVIVGVNRGSAVASARFAPPQEWADSAIVEALSSRTIIPQNGFVEMDFVGREAKIFVASKE
ncbi:MAG TPA: alpha-amylase family glycosyl hydrolase, partial [Acidobacteriota bacterium]|nr:alpha-amylase family glycosyl hydrolase [Acidobacteriota bacterium]